MSMFVDWLSNNRTATFHSNSTHLLAAKQLGRIDLRVVRQSRRYDDILVRHVEQRQTTRGLRHTSPTDIIILLQQFG